MTENGATVSSSSNYMYKKVSLDEEVVKELLGA